MKNIIPLERPLELLKEDLKVYREAIIYFPFMDGVFREEIDKALLKHTGELAIKFDKENITIKFNELTKKQYNILEGSFLEDKITTGYDGSLDITSVTYEDETTLFKGLLDEDEFGIIDGGFLSYERPSLAMHPLEYIPSVDFEFRNIFASLGKQMVSVNSAIIIECIIPKGNYIYRGGQGRIISEAIIATETYLYQKEETNV